MKMVRKTHPYDGSVNAGRPIGPVLGIVSVHRHEPQDGVGCCFIANLTDGSWAFLHNLHLVKDFLSA